MDKIDLPDITNEFDSNNDLSNIDLAKDLDEVISTGKKKLRTRKRIKSSILAVSLILISSLIITIGLSFRSNDSKTDLNVLNNVKFDKNQQNNSSTSLPKVTTKEAIQTQTPFKATPFVNYGNANVCNSETVIPGDGQVQVGPASVIETWKPKLNETKEITSVDSDRVIKIINQQNDSNGSTAANLVSGYIESGFANTNASSLRYCETGLSISINKSADSYTINTIRW